MPIDVAAQGTSQFARIEHAIVDFVLAGQFPKRNYTCDLGDAVEDLGDRYKTLVDYTTLLAPGEILVSEVKKTYSKDTRSAKLGAFAMQAQDYSILTVLTFPCMVDVSYFEQSMMQSGIIVPAEYDAEGLTLQGQAVVNVQDLRVTQPPRQNPETGTRMDITFRVTLARQ